MYVYYKGKRYKVVKDEKGRPGVWVTTRTGRKVFITIRELHERAVREQRILNVLRVFYHLGGGLFTLVGVANVFGKLFFPKKVALTTTVRLGSRYFRIPQISILLGSFYVAERVARRLSKQIPAEKIRDERFLRERLHENFLGITKKPPVGVLPRQVPDSHLRGLTWVEVKNPEIALLQLKKKASVFTHPERVSHLGGFYVPHAKALFFSRQPLVSGFLKRFKWDPRRAVTHEVGHHVYQLAKEKAQKDSALRNLLERWNAEYTNATQGLLKRRKVAEETFACSYLTDPDEGFARYYAMTFAGDDQITPQKKWIQLIGLKRHKKLMSLFKLIIERI